MSLNVMKGQPYTQKRLIQWLKEDRAVVVQVKRDEIRCQVAVCGGGTVTFTSASGKPLYNLDSFSDVFRNVAKVTGVHSFDTGVCVNDSFDLTRRTVMAKTKPYDLSGYTVNTLFDGREDDPLRPGKKRDKVHYVGPLRAVFWLYDLPYVKEPYIQRRISMARLAMYHPDLLCCPETDVIMAELGDSLLFSVLKVEAALADAFERGHEGLMLKRVNHAWEPRRTTSWMKMKSEEEVDVTITGAIPGEGKYTGLIGSLTAQADDGSTVSFSGFTDEERNAISDNLSEYIGRVAEVRFMQRDSLGGYRHPRFYRWHPDK